MSDYTPPVPAYGVIAKCKIAEEHYGKLHLVTTMQQYYTEVSELNELDQHTINDALRHGLNVYLFPIREETSEQWLPAFPLLDGLVYQFVGPHETVDLAQRLTLDWMNFAENCKQCSGTRLMIRGATPPDPNPIIEWRNPIPKE